MPYFSLNKEQELHNEYLENVSVQQVQTLSVTESEGSESIIMNTVVAGEFSVVRKIKVSVKRGFTVILNYLN